MPLFFSFLHIPVHDIAPIAERRSMPSIGFCSQKE
jgi:hypothetical protein